MKNTDSLVIVNYCVTTKGGDMEVFVSYIGEGTYDGCRELGDLVSAAVMHKPLIHGDIIEVSQDGYCRSIVNFIGDSIVEVSAFDYVHYHDLKEHIRNVVAYKGRHSLYYKRLAESRHYASDEAKTVVTEDSKNEYTQEETGNRESVNDDGRSNERRNDSVARRGRIE